MIPHYEGIIGYKELPKYKRAAKGMGQFLAFPLAVRKPLLNKLIERNAMVGLRLVIEGGDKVFEGFDQKERQEIWFRVICNNGIEFIAQNLNLTSRKSVDLLKVVLNHNSDHFFDTNRMQASRVYWLANLLCQIRWQDIPELDKKHPLFAGIITSQLRQGFRPTISPAGWHLCPIVENNFVACIEKRKVVLVNEHLLFRTWPEWSVALCLRTFVSPNGSVFLAGMYYFIRGEENRLKLERLIKEGVERAVMEDVVWTPGRYSNPRYSKKFDVRDISVGFPA